MLTIRQQTKILTSSSSNQTHSVMNVRKRGKKILSLGLYLSFIAFRKNTSLDLWFLQKHPSSQVASLVIQISITEISTDPQRKYADLTANVCYWSYLLSHQRCCRL